MKKYIGPICWLAAVVIWVTISGINYTEGNMGFAVVQLLISALCLIHEIRTFLKNKKA